MNVQQAEGNPASLLQTTALSKRYGTVAALEGVDFKICAGEIVGLVGRRGSGKSTFLNLLGGLQFPSDGQIWVEGREAHLTTPQHAQRLGIQLIHQKPVLLEKFSVLRYLMLGRESGWFARLGFPNWGEMAQQAQSILTDFEMPPEILNEEISNLSDEQRQIVAITGVLCSTARLLMLDDSFAALSYPRQQMLLERLKKLASEGAAILISSDNLKHLFAVTDRILVLYEGRVIADRRTSDSTQREVVELMVGASRYDQVTPIIWALESYHLAQQQAEELGQAQAALRENLAAQDSLNQQLVERLREQLIALDQLNVALQATHRRLITEREQERKHLARELHDQAIQDLLSFNYRLEEVESHTRDAALHQELAAIRGGIRQVVSDLRDVCSNLRPPTIDSHGLVSAIRSFAQAWAEQTNVHLQLSIDPKLGRLPEAIELSIFRIVQEGLNNIKRHAKAKHVELVVERTPTASLLIRLADDGQGLAQPLDLLSLSTHKHYGLLSISERVALLNGMMQIDSPAAGGVILRIEIPTPYPPEPD